VPDRRDDVAAFSGAPPHGLVTVLAWVPAETVSRARRHQLAHDRVLHVVRDHHERTHPVTSTYTWLARRSKWLTDDGQHCARDGHLSI
jgi:hypothetical protein